VFYLVACILSAMRWTVAHVVASVVASLLFLGVSCMPASLEKENFVARLHIERRGVASPRSVNDSTPLYNATNDNSTVSSSSPGVVGHVAEYVMRNVGVIYRGLAVLGCISAIVVVYITYRYFRWEFCARIAITNFVTAQYVSGLMMGCVRLWVPVLVLPTHSRMQKYAIYHLVWIIYYEFCTVSLHSLNY